MRKKFILLIAVLLSTALTQAAKHCYAAGNPREESPTDFSVFQSAQRPLLARSYDPNDEQHAAPGVGHADNTQESTPHTESNDGKREQVET